MANKGIFSQTKNNKVYFQKHVLKELLKDMLQRKVKWFGMNKRMVREENSKYLTKFKSTWPHKTNADCIQIVIMYNITIR